MHKKTHEEYVRELAIKNPNLEVIGMYIDAKTKIKHRCKKHNVIWDISPSNALKNQGCVKCKYEKLSSNQLKSHEQYLKEVVEKNPHVLVLGTYIGANKRILHKCKYCGKEWFICPSDILEEKSCRECACKRFGAKVRKLHTQYVDELFNINPNIEPIEDYINTDTSILHRCKICRHIWSIKPNHTLRGHGCPICGFKSMADSKRKPQEQYIQELFYVNPSIEVIGEYVNYTTPLLHRCKKCGNEWEAKPMHTMRGHGCTSCNESHGERGISVWLDNNMIEYIPQYRFDDCRDRYPLPFDFYLPQHNICIEYNGRQHYESIDFFGGEDAFKVRQQHDNIKKNYCQNNDISLLCISYQQDIKEELNKFLLI